jgi:Leucine-rich repeat (LRR) protein
MNNYEWQRQLNLLMRPTAVAPQNQNSEQPQTHNGLLRANNSQGDVQLNTVEIVKWFEGRAFTEPSERAAVSIISIDGRRVPSITSIIDNLDKFPNLQQLYINNANVEEITDSIENLQNLTVLDISDNRIRRLSDKIGNLHKLEVLYIEKNFISELPEGIVNLNLQEFKYFDNDFTQRWVTLPDDIKEFLERYLDQQPEYLREDIARMENPNQNVNNVLGMRPTNYERMPELNENINQTVNEIIHQEVGGIAFQVHNFYHKINMDRLLEFIKENIDINTDEEVRKIRTMKDIVRYIDNTFTGIINNMNTTPNKSTTLKEFKRVFGTHLIPKRYNVKDVKLIVSCLEYVKKQPKVFQEAYVSSYTHDCAHAYNGQGNQMSCSKGTIERLVTSLTPAAIAVESSNKNTYKAKKYGQLILILDASSINKLISDYGGDCMEEAGNSKDKFIECAKRKIKERLGENSYNNSVVSRALNDYTQYLNFSGGKRRKPIRTRKAKKNLRKTVSKHKKLLKKVYKNKTRKYKK